MKLLERCTDELKRRLPIDYKGVCFDSSIPQYRTLLTRYLGVGEGDHQGWSQGDGFR
jgi:hypothetical protein